MWKTIVTGHVSFRESATEARPHYERNMKLSLISKVRPTVHTNPSRKRSFSKTLFKPGELENAGFAFSWGRKGRMFTG